MRVFISADMEGITGLVSWIQCGKAHGDHYDWPFARRMMTHDVNAAIRGARAAGASEVVVKDSHGTSKNLLIDELEPGARLISGKGAGATDFMMQGIGDGPFDAAVLVGYHAMAGTPKGVMEHTFTGGIHRLWVNGRQYGEIGLAIATAGRYGVPVVAATSDAAGAAEAEAFAPGLCAAVVKTGLGRYMADLLPPDLAGPRIEAAVREGLERRASTPATVEGRAVLAVEFNRTEAADLCEHHPAMRRKDGYTVEGDFANYEAAHAAAYALVELSLHSTTSAD